MPPGDGVPLPHSPQPFKRQRMATFGSTSWFAPDDHSSNPFAIAPAVKPEPANSNDSPFRALAYHEHEPQANAGQGLQMMTIKPEYQSDTSYYTSEERGPPIKSEEQADARAVGLREQSDRERQRENTAPPPICTRCGKRHGAPCWKCFICGNVHRGECRFKGKKVIKRSRPPRRQPYHAPVHMSGRNTTHRTNAGPNNTNPDTAQPEVKKEEDDNNRSKFINQVLRSKRDLNQAQYDSLTDIFFGRDVGDGEH